jgi:hypothetical protein
MNRKKPPPHHTIIGNQGIRSAPHPGKAQPTRHGTRSAARQGLTASDAPSSSSTVQRQRAEGVSQRAQRTRPPGNRRHPTPPIVQRQVSAAQQPQANQSGRRPIPLHAAQPRAGAKLARQPQVPRARTATAKPQRAPGVSAGNRSETSSKVLPIQKAPRQAAARAQHNAVGSSVHPLRARQLTSPRAGGATSETVQLKIDFRRIHTTFLNKSRDWRYTKMQSEPRSTLTRLSTFLQGERQTPDVIETQQDLLSLLGEQQTAEITRADRSGIKKHDPETGQLSKRNWANASFVLDGAVLFSSPLTPSGIYASRKKSTYARASDRARNECDIEISSGDSEVTVFDLMDRKLDWSEVGGAANAIELLVVSTNGACNACKGRINRFMSKVARHVRGGVRVQSTYKYLKAPAAANRGVATFYGWSGDPRGADNFYTHVTNHPAIDPHRTRRQVRARTQRGRGRRR